MQHSVVTKVVRLPLEALTHPVGASLHRREPLGREEIKPLLRFGTGVDLVVSSVGEPLRWMSDDAMREFWRDDASRRVAEPGAQIALEDFPDERCYLAYLWSDEDGKRRVVELQEMH